MKKKFIKMNDNDDNLSLGNLFRVIKELSKNKTSAMQTELFCVLFEVLEVNDTTINNYCVGCRRIGDDYKQKYLNMQKKYETDKTIFFDIIINILSIMDGRVYVLENNQKNFINNNENMKALCFKLYNISKNDQNVNKPFLEKIDLLLKDNDYYSVLVEFLFYIVLYKKQPLYESDLKKEVMESILNDTYISCSGLQEYLVLKLRESINYDYSLKKMALSGNAYACFEIGSNEFCGYVKGYPRYEEAYKYLKIAASYNHAGACYMIGSMFYRGFLGNQTPEDYKMAYDNLVQASSLGNIAALNVLGLMYLHGEYSLEKDVPKALEYFNKGALNDYAFSLNNLGRYYEIQGDKAKAFTYYLRSADLEESWACNKVGQFYECGEVITKDIAKAYEYYEKATLANHRTICYYAYYNLARLLMVGDVTAGIKRDLVAALKNYEIASNQGIFEATRALFLYYAHKYQQDNEHDYLDKVYKYKGELEKNEKFNEEMAREVEEKLKKIRNQKEIDISFLLG